MSSEAADHVPVEDQPVIAWPKITATVGNQPAETGSAGTLVINGIVHPCWAGNTDILRIGMIARCTSTAIRLRRPVRVEVTEDGQAWALAVRPDGIVQELDKQGRIIPTYGELSPIEGPCRRCREVTPVTVQSCTACGVDEPLGVLAAAPYSSADPSRTDVLETES